MIVAQLLRIASAVTKLHVISGAVKLIAKSGKFFLQTNAGLLALSTLMNHWGM